MSRFLIGLGLMGLLLGLGLYSAHAIETIHDPIVQTLEQAAESRDLRQAEVLLQQAKQKWDRHRNSTATLAEHNSLDEIDSLFAQAQAYIEAGQLGDFSAFCLHLAQLLRATAEEHQPTWWNFL